MDILKDYFNAEFLFTAVPPRETNLYLPLSILFAFLILLAVVFRFVHFGIAEVNRRFVYPCLTFGLLGLLHLFGRYENLPWLGARVTLLAIVAIMSTVLIYNFVWTARFVPAYLINQEKRNRFERYLPKQKQKK